MDKREIKCHAKNDTTPSTPYISPFILLDEKKAQVSGSDDDGGGNGGGKPKWRETIQYIIILRNIVYSQNVCYF